MTHTHTGGCACGAIRYEVSDEAVFQNHCQCRDCRIRSGTGHSSFLTFPDRTRVKIFGEARLWDVVADSGHMKSHAFCPTCGSPVYLTFAAMPALFTVHAGSLDHPENFKPHAVTYAARGHGWDVLDPALKTFEGMPG